MTTTTQHTPANQPDNAVALTIPDARKTAIVNKNGKTVGTRVAFGGEYRAKDVAARLKAAQPKIASKALKLAVNNVITGRTTLAFAELQVGIEGLRAEGYTPDYCDVRKSGATIRFVKPTEPTEPKDTKLALATARIAELEAQLEASMMEE